MATNSSTRAENEEDNSELLDRTSVAGISVKRLVKSGERLGERLKFKDDCMRTYVDNPRANVSESGFELLEDAEDSEDSILRGIESRGLCEKKHGAYALRLRHYIENAVREARKRKFNFCLGTSSILIVVVVAATCQTLLANTPAIFLQQAEAESGQFDIMFTPSDGRVGAPFMNYTQFAVNLAQNAVEPSIFSFHSPRHERNAIIFSPLCTKTTQNQGFDPYDATWKYPTSYESALCDGYPVEMGCIPVHCPNDTNKSTSFRLVNMHKEYSMGLGRAWKHVNVGEDEIVIGAQLANELNARIGDVVYVGLDLDTNDDALLRNIVMLDERLNASSDEYLSVSPLVYTSQRWSGVILPMKIQQIVDGDTGKFASGDSDFIVAEYSTFLQYVSKHMAPALDRQIKDRVHNAEMDAFAHKILLNIPNREIAYADSNYDNIQRRVIDFASAAVYAIGYPSTHNDMPLIQYLEQTKYFSLYLGFIINIIIVILFMLSTLLVYSLLMISVETRTFELGVFRMVGLERKGIISMLLIQAFSFSFPAWAIGLILSQFISLLLVPYLSHQVGVPLQVLLTRSAIITASLLGLVIPAVSCILPIRAALAKNLHESLDTQHSKTKAVEVSIERSEDGDISPLAICVGVGLAVFGFMIYYLLPMSLITLNLTLFFNIFFGILIGLLFGLIILSLNFEHLLERLLVCIFLWWERRPIPTLILKNLVAHRSRNRKTTIMYAVALGFILFITVSYRLELKTAELRARRAAGCDMYIESLDIRGLNLGVSSTIYALIEELKFVKSWTWYSASLHSFSQTNKASQVANLGHVYHSEVVVRAIPPNFFEVADSQFLSIDEDVSSLPTSSMSLSQQLYSIRGSQTVLTASYFAKLLNLHDSGTRHRDFLLNVAMRDNLGASLFRVEPLSLLKLAPAFTVSSFPRKNQDVLVGFPSFVAMSNGAIDSIRCIPMARILIQFNGDATNAEKDSLRNALNQIIGAAASNMKIWDFRTTKSSLVRTKSAMDFVFITATLIAMFLCFFSLMASMYTNIYEQTKEIGVLRSLGLSAQSCGKLYVYEAFILVMAASLLGIFIGTMLAWSMMAQRAMFTQLPMDMEFPYTLALLVLTSAIICSVACTVIPTRAVMMKPVSQVFRMFV